MLDTREFLARGPTGHQGVAGTMNARHMEIIDTSNVGYQGIIGTRTLDTMQLFAR